MRLRALLMRARGDLLRLIYPNLAQSVRLGQSDMSSTMRGVWVATATLFSVFALCVMALAPGLPSLEAASRPRCSQQYRAGL